MSTLGTETDWLSLTEYSNEYGVSVSTLRRRIKGKKIKYKQLHGKYYLPRQPLPSQTPSSKPVPASSASSSTSSEGEGNSLNAARSLLDELKKAYMQSLQSKEDQILHLKQQITDLKTLVMYLEREITRLKPGDN